jgi:hypothetical protein
MSHGAGNFNVSRASRICMGCERRNVCSGHVNREGEYVIVAFIAKKIDDRLSLAFVQTILRRVTLCPISNAKALVQFPRDLRMLWGLT